MVGDVFSGGEDFDIYMDFRTDQLNALLLFTYGTQTDDYMLVRRTDTFKIINEYKNKTCMTLACCVSFDGVDL